MLKFHLIPIRDWNPIGEYENFWLWVLKFHLIPIRDWNSMMTPEQFKTLDKQVEISLNPY